MISSKDWSAAQRQDAAFEAPMTYEQLPLWDVPRTPRSQAGPADARSVSRTTCMGGAAGRRRRTAETAAAGALEALGRQVAHELNNALTVVLANISLAAEDVDGPAQELLTAAQEAGAEVRAIAASLPVRLGTATPPGQAPWDGRWHVSPAALDALRTCSFRRCLRVLLRLEQVLAASLAQDSVSAHVDLVHGIDGDDLVMVLGWAEGRPDPRRSVALRRLERALGGVGGVLALTRSAGQAELRLALPVAAVTPHPARPRRILLMDDERGAREAAARILASEYDVAEAEDGGSALRLFHAARRARRPFALALLDLSVAHGMGGEEAGRRMLKADPGLRVMILSGEADRRSVEDWQHLGFGGALSKPYTARELRCGVERVLNRGA